MTLEQHARIDRNADVEWIVIRHYDDPIEAQMAVDYLRSNGRDLEFRVDADTNAMVITVREAASGEVIRQIPSEEALQMRRYLDEWSGTFLNVTT